MDLNLANEDDVKLVQQNNELTNQDTASITNRIEMQLDHVCSLFLII